jgi:hypothetical protein
MKFKSLVAESLESNDVVQFKNIFESALNQHYVRKQKDLFKSIWEQNDPEMSMVTEVQAAAKSFGAKSFVYDQGVLTLTVPSGKAAIDLGKYLDEKDCVDSYEIYRTDETDEGGATDLDKMTEDTTGDYEFNVFFVTDDVQFESYEIVEEMEEDEEGEDDDDEDEEEDDEDEDPIEEKKKLKESDEEDGDGDDEDEEDPIEEKSKATKKKLKEAIETFGIENWINEVEKKVTFQAGLKKIKMQCPPGQKWNPTTKKCVRMDAAENRKRHIMAIKAARKRAPKAGIAAIKRGKSMKKRIAAGY